jgi:hypothetical protein
MEKIDRLGWAAGFSFLSQGARLGVRVTDAGILERLAGYLPPGWKPSAVPVVDELFSLVVGGARPGSSVRRYHLLYWGSGRVARTLDLDEALAALESVTDLGVAVRARRRVFLHAGVVGWRGSAIVVLGPRSGGKTALVAALVRAGATYYSDRFAVLDERGLVHPYARPLAFPAEPGRPRTRCPAEALGGMTGARPLPVGLVVVTQFQPGARWRPRRLSPGETALALLAHAVHARLRPERALATVQRVATAATALKGKRGEADGFATVLINNMSNLTPAGLRRVPASAAEPLPAGTG